MVKKKNKIMQAIDSEGFTLFCVLVALGVLGIIAGQGVYF